MRKLLIAALGIWAGGLLSASAALAPYTGGGLLLNNQSDIITAGVVGTIGGTTGQGQGDPAWQGPGAQAVLDLTLGGSGMYAGEQIYANKNYDYSGTIDLSGSTLVDTSGNTTVPAGWNFVIAKYDGKQAGYVLFYLGGASATIPTSPDNFWTTTPGQYGISGWIGFDAVPEPTTVLAGGGALGLLLFGAGVHSRRSVLRIGK